MKRTVIERLRQAEQWFAANGPQWAWMRELVSDAQQELEAQSGSLWCQWMTSRTGHIRMFVAGDMGPRELDSFMEMLKLSRSYMDDEKVAGGDAPRVIPQHENHEYLESRVDKGVGRRATGSTAPTD